MTKIMLAQSIKVCHNVHGRVLTGRVSIHSHLLANGRNPLVVFHRARSLVFFLFMIYINNIYKASNKLSFYLFADDTNLL